MTSRRRMMALSLALVLLISLLPTFSALAEERMGMTTVNSVNVRQSASTKSPYLFQLPMNYVFTINDTVRAEGLDWYKITVVSPAEDNNRSYPGYIQAKFVRELTQDEITAYKAGQAISTSNGETTPVNAPSASTAAEAGATGVVTNSGVNFRAGPSKGDKVITQLNRGTVVTLLEVPETISEKTFYKVSYNGQVGYIMSTYLLPSNSAESVNIPTQAAATATPTPTPAYTGDVWGYVKTTKGGVNLRMTPGGTRITQVGKNLTFPVLLQPIKQNSYTWYFVQAGNNRGYLRSDCVKVVSDPAPTAAPTATPTPTPGGSTETATPTPTPTPAPTAAVLGYVKTTASGVNFRKKVDYGDVLGQIGKGTILPFYSKTTIKKVVWYGVYSSKLGNGFLHGNYVMECDADGNAVTNTPTPTPAPGNPTPTPAVTPTSSQQEASYNTLKLGSSGTAVKNLTTELKKQGYYSGEPGTKYTTAVETAVKKFQEANNLTVDGIAGAATQHKLYGTVPVGAADTSNLSMTLYPAEKIDWYTGGINELWARGSNYKIYDVKTGIVWWAHRWAGGNHVDAEPLTAADTARLCKCYGVTTSQEIKDKDLYQRRPCLVTIGTRTFACSLYGVPHNYPDGDTIPDNDFKGQVCIHFTNSRVHNSNKVDSGHQDAIEYAWKNAPNGHV